ncbi:lysophospholipid acyltransferase family protein [Aureibacter tunicatorum]|uniref:Hemolysin n=1 Tax=Aureibacter tunicatorum TaxID=866807 RepID=A0AAE3XTB9_9BACT|nr:lysophospholipid acyltransferase family protein [Aureibacter tunicatorum]MDR6241634.1 putative hemolysin [Aureibacter tunicatorum]BDD07250.1 glycerol acyltransferase [Aureibacter tunicatorum]
MKELISKQEFVNAVKLNNYQAVATPLMKILGLSKLNEMYDQIYMEQGLDFIHALFDMLNIKIEVDEKELERIPLTGSFISIANHPFGAVDGMILILLISKIRPEYKVMANFILQQVSPIKDAFISVNPFENMKQAHSSVTGMKAAIKHLNDGNPMGIFPAGEVSTFSASQRKITDRPWQKTAVKLVKNAKQPVIPIYFQGSNSKLFHILGLIHPSLRTAALPSEMLKKKNEVIRLRIGKPISVKEQMEYKDLKSYTQFLRMKTYALGSAIENDEFIKKLKISKPVIRNPKPVNIAEQVPEEVLEAEIQTLSEFKLLSKNNFTSYIVPTERIPNILKEIGRLRELTFREVGEGSNNAVDLDEFDQYYRHLFLWDEEKKKIAGAYRIGLGQEIIKTHGQEGFYSNSLFKMKPEFDKVLERSLELGRSFVVKDYQQHRIPLFLLWKSLIYFLMQNKEQYQYFLGPASISNKYADYSKSLIASFIQKYHFDHDKAKLVKPRNEYKFRFNDDYTQMILDITKADLKKLDKYIQDIDPSHFTVPVLLKKYIYQNAKIIGFNVDPNFNNCLDGLVILDFYTMPKESLDNMQKEIQQELQSKK